MAISRTLDAPFTRPTTPRQVFAHAHAGEDGQLFFLLEVRVLHCSTCERARGAVSSIVESRGAVLRKLQAGRKPFLVVGCWSQSGRRRVATWRPWTWSRLRRKLAGICVTWYTSWSATCSALINLQSGTTLTSHSGARSVRIF